MNGPIVVFGANGQVGYELVRTLLPLGNVVAATRAEADLAHPDRVVEFLRQTRPSLVVNAAAYTAVDRAESEPELAELINATAPTRMSEVCTELGVRLIHYSTDYVFDGTGSRPYRESDLVNPLGVYGRTKRAGELGVLSDPRNLVLRVAWVYGARGRNFLLTMLRLAREGKPLRVVDDQVGTPTWCRAIAEATALVAHDLLRAPDAPGGLYHLPSAGETTWCGFAREIFAQALGADAPAVTPISTADYPTPAPRPAYSVLDGEAFLNRFGFRLPDWSAQLRLALS